MARTLPLTAFGTGFIVTGVAFGALAVHQLRENNIEMIRLREAVHVADQQGGDVDTALNDLRRHVYAHMNTDLTTGKNPITPPIQLKHRYERLSAAAEEQAKATNDQRLAKAEADCAQKHPGTGYNASRVVCVQNAMAASTMAVADVPDDLYKFDFQSPSWSPDLAGWSIVASIMSFLMAVPLVVLGRLQRLKKQP